MDNKTRVKVAVVIGIVVLAVIFVFMIVFVKENRPKKNKNIPTVTNGYAETNKNTVVDDGNKTNNGKENTSLDDVVSIAIKNGSLVKVSSDFSSNEIIKLEDGYTEFCYGENKVYTVYNNEDGSCSIFEIDLLKDKSTQKSIFTSSDYGKIKNVKYYAGKLYFVSEQGALVEYSISEEYVQSLTNDNEVSSFAVDENKDILYVSYKPNGENAGVYILDFTANTFTQIIQLDDLPGELILSGTSLVIDVKEFQTLYVYNITNNSVVAVGADNYFKEPENHIAFFDNVLLYTDGEKIDLKDESGNSYQDNWYNLNDRTIASISMLDSKTLQIARFDENGAGAGKVTRSIIIDLLNGTTTENADSVYTDVVRIK